MPEDERPPIAGRASDRRASTATRGRCVFWCRISRQLWQTWPPRTAGRPAGPVHRARLASFGPHCAQTIPLAIQVIRMALQKRFLTTRIS